MRGDAARVWQEPINIQSIADVSGIPKETVRRKVALLVAKGWVARDPTGRLSTTRKAGRDLRIGTEASVAYLAGLRSVLGAA